jgi:RHS repeat-associated protein
MVKSSTNQEKCYAHLSLAEREEIAVALEQGQSMRSIAFSLGRSPSTIRRGSGAGNEARYESRIDWDPVFGVKELETDENGEEITYGYDPYGRLVKVYSPYDQTFPAVAYQYVQEPGKNWYTVTTNKVSIDPDDKHSIRTVLVIDGLGRTIVTGKDGATWDKEGKKEVPGWNISGGVAYDGKGRKVAAGQSEFADGAELSAVLNFRYAGGLVRETTTAYDTQDRPIEVRLPDNSVQTNRYWIAALGTINHEVSESRDALFNRSGAAGNRTVQYRDGRGNIIQIEKYGKDGETLTSVRYNYNGLGELVEARDYAGNPLLVEYDLMGRRVAMESGDIGRKEYVYDRYGNLAYETDSVLRGKGQKIRYEYDDLDRLVTIDYPESGDTVYEYGEDGAEDGTANRIRNVTDESGDTTYAYGKLGETVRETRAIKTLNPNRPGDKTERTMEYRSNYLGQMEWVRYPGDDNVAETVYYEYNRGGQVNKVWGERPGLDDYEYVNAIGYDRFGQRAYIAYGNGTSTDYVYDDDRRWLTGITTEGTEPDSKRKETVQDIRYRIDVMGNVEGYTNKAARYTTEQTYGYDNLYQLTAANGKSAGTVIGGQYTVTYEQSFAFDKIGNMTEKKSKSGGLDSKGNLTYTLQYQYGAGSAHRAEKIGNMYYRYDGNGNLTNERYGSPVSVGPEGVHVQEEGGIYSTDYGFAMRDPYGGNTGPAETYQRDYKWNERSQLVESRDRSNHVLYRYGADGQRAVKYTEGGREVLYFNQMVQRENVVNKGWMESRHIFVGETRIVTKQRMEDAERDAERKQQYFYHGDHLGSAQLVTDYEGRVYEHIEYTPYGEMWIERGTSKLDDNKTPFRFTGKEFDEETGLYYYGARYLNPQTSMWLSADPAMGEYIPRAPINDEARRYNGNLPGMGGVYNYVNLHTYHYAGNNPVKLVDPTGRDFIDDVDAAIERIKQNSPGSQSVPLKDLINTENLAKTIKSNPDKLYGTANDKLFGLFSDAKTRSFVLSKSESEIQQMLDGMTVIMGVDKAAANREASLFGIPGPGVFTDAQNVGNTILYYDTFSYDQGGVFDSAVANILGHETIHGLQVAARGGLEQYMPDFVAQLSLGYYSRPFEKAAYNFGPANNNSGARAPILNAVGSWFRK